jgi:hypothetical protein
VHVSVSLLPGAGRLHSRLAVGALLALTLILLPALRAPAAHASSPLDFSAGDQYVETLPTARGPKVTENAPKRRSTSGLSKRARQQLRAQGGSEVATLEYVAVSPELGAPPPGASSGEDRSGPDGSGDRRGNAKGAANGSPSVPSAAINAVAGSGSGLGWLALALPLITAIALGAFGFQRRRDRDAG